MDLLRAQASHTVSGGKPPDPLVYGGPRMGKVGWYVQVGNACATAFETSLKDVRALGHIRHVFSFPP